MGEIVNHCALCGTQIEPEEQLCAECREKNMEPCPDCGKVVCECEAGEAG